MASPRDDVVDPNSIEVVVPVEAPAYSQPLTKEDLKGVSEEMKVAFDFKPNATHNWIQHGNQIDCTSCGLGHGLFIDPNKYRMVGINSQTGMPIIVEISKEELES